MSDEPAAPNADRALSQPPSSAATGIHGLRLCICTPDYVHLVKNGGIGTSFQHTARTFAQHGAIVTVLYTRDVRPLSLAEKTAAVNHVKQEGAKLEFLQDGIEAGSTRQFNPDDPVVFASYLAYQWLKVRDFDIVLFPDWQGLAFYAAHAKVEGLAFQRTALWVQGHSSSLWHKINNQATHFTEADVRLFHYERTAIRLADAFLCATQYLLDWKKDHGFRLPEHTCVLPLIVRQDLLPSASAEARSDDRPRPIKEIVFFGRLEKRKGLQIFLQALQRLFQVHEKNFIEWDINVTFLGKIVPVDGLSSADYIAQHLKGRPVRYTILPSLGTADAVAYLSRRQALAVMPSLTDNSPMAVHECIAAAIPFLATKAGGIPEIVHEDDHAHALVRPTVRDLAEGLLRAILNGQRLARPAVHQSESIIPRWLDLAATTAAAAMRTEPMPTAMPLVSVCVTHYERPVLLRRTLRGIQAQTYRNIEVILVDNGSKGAEAVKLLAEVGTEFPGLDVRVFQLPDLYAGAARNTAIAKSRGEYVLIMDDDNYAHPEQIRILVQAAETSGYDALTCAAVCFPETEADPVDLSKFHYLFLPAGSGLAVNLFGNYYGDANALFRKSALLAIGGFTEERLSWEDYEIFSALEHEGYTVAVVPEPLLFLRETSGSVSRSGAMIGNYYRALRPAFKHLPWNTYGDALLVALNNPLGAHASAPLDAAPDPRKLALLDHADMPLVIDRLILRAMFDAGQVDEALEHNRRLFASSPALAPLSLDLLLSTLFVSGVSAVAEMTDIPAAQALAASILGRDLGPLLESLRAAAERRILSPDEQYLLGLSEIMSGDFSAGLVVWAGMLAEADTAYLHRYPDVAAAAASRGFRSGLDHFIRFGSNEGRVFGYVPPAHPLFARASLVAPPRYAEHLKRNVSACATPPRGKLVRLIGDIIVSGAVIAAADFAMHAKEGLSWLPFDLRISKALSQFSSGLLAARTLPKLSAGDQAELRRRVFGALDYHRAPISHGVKGSLLNRLLYAVPSLLRSKRSTGC